ncbi:FBLN5 isoform 9 [Pan troglodytes]|uniref:FBLN5 isoform 9 n=1 Tax=Pan troglodytes TaxID=9598 RepID=A0A2J8PL49_PANTR|nr:FBLN5 isoform 9 [Pan troglodytes]
MPGIKRILTVTILALCLPSPGNAQQQERWTPVCQP